MKCRLSWLADDTSVGAVVDIFEGKGCLIQWNPDELDTRNDKSQSSTRTHTKSSAWSRLILYTSISKYRRATLLLFSTWGGLSKDFTQRYTSRKHEAVDTLQQEKYFLDIWKKKGWKWTETESGTGTGLPERLWKIHPWRWGEFDWQGPDQRDRILKFALPDLEVGLYYLLSYPSLNKFHCCTFGYFYKLILQVGQTCKPVT